MAGGMASGSQSGRRTKRSSRVSWWGMVGTHLPGHERLARIHLPDRLPPHPTPVSETTAEAATATPETATTSSPAGTGAGSTPTTGHRCLLLPTPLFAAADFATHLLPHPLPSVDAAARLGLGSSGSCLSGSCIRIMPCDLEVPQQRPACLETLSAAQECNHILLRSDHSFSPFCGGRPRRWQVLHVCAGIANRRRRRMEWPGWTAKWQSSHLQNDWNEDAHGGAG